MISFWDQEHKVSVYRHSPSAFSAVGDFMGILIETKGATVAAAITSWQEAVWSKGG